MRLLLGLAALALPQAAAACENPDDGLALIHAAVPERIPAGAVVARVTLLHADERILYSTGVRARIDRLIHGALRSREVLVRVRDYGSCSHSFANGRSGILVAVPGPVVNGILTVTAIEARRGDGFRLRR